jgi:hypothetical protein
LVKALDPPTPSSGADSPSPSADESANTNNLTVYTLRLTTSAARNAGATDPSAAVQVLLLATDGRAVLRRVPPVYDPQDAERQARHICSVVAGGGGGGAEGVGADCSRFLAEEEGEQKGGSDDDGKATTKRPASAATSPAPPPRPAPAGPVRPRFQPGAVDEVSFLAPDLGHPLAALIVAPESGTWMLDEATVSSSRTGRSDRFVCRSLLGSGAPGAARAAERRRGGGGGGGGPSSSSKGPAYLTPVAAGAVVVGEGSAARALTRAEAEALHEEGMDGYSRLRGRVTAATAVLAATGSFIAGLVGGVDAAAPFALGGLAGLGYWALLQLGVAAALPPEGAALEAAAVGGGGGGGEGGSEAATARSASPSPTARPTGSPLIRFLGSGPFRVAAVGAVAVIAASAARYWGPAPGVGVGASSLGGGGGGDSGSTAVEAPLVAGTATATKSSRNNSPHSALRSWQLGLAAAGFLPYRGGLVGGGPRGGGGGDGEGDDEGGRGSGNGNGGNGGGTALSARELEAMLAMRAPSPSAGTEAGAEDGEEDD